MAAKNSYTMRVNEVNDESDYKYINEDDGMRMLLY